MQQRLLDGLASLGIQLSADALLVMIVIISIGVGVIINKFMSRSAMRAERQRHSQELEAVQQQNDDQIDQLSNTFSALSQRALHQNNEAFLTLAKQNFEQLRQASIGDLRTRQQSFDNLVRPIEDSLKATREQIQKFDTNRKVGDAQLGEQISNLLETQHLLHTETRNLSSALRRPEIRGQWGELTLKRLVELAGLSEHCDFSEQASVKSESGLLRPDMIIHLPSSRQLIVDVKTPLDAFLTAAESTSESDKSALLAKHAKNLKSRIIELSTKRYWQQFDLSPDFIILFIPGDQFLSSALQADSSLLEYALEKKVLLATPTSLVGLLRAIAYGWNQDAMSKNTIEIKQVAETLAHRLNVLSNHLNKLGQNIDQTVKQFARTAGSFSKSTVPAVEKLAKLGVTDEDYVEIDAPTSITTSPETTPEEHDE